MQTMRRNGRAIGYIISTPLSLIEEERADSEDGGTSNPRYSIASALKRKSTL